MSYSRRDFLKAAGSGVVLTAVTAGTSCGRRSLFRLPSSCLAAPFANEKASFIVNGKTYAAEYEARTTLWEVISMKLGLTGTNRSCNRASCGACSVLVDGTPFYSCHTLATEAVGKKILTIEGMGDEKNLHPLQRIGHTRVAADCGFCTAGWVVTAKGLLDKNPNPNEDQVKAALAGHICRCSAYPNIIRAVMDSAAVLRGSKMTNRTRTGFHRSDQDADGAGLLDHRRALSGQRSVEGASKTVTKKWQGYPPENLKVLGKPLPPLPEVSIPRFTGKRNTPAACGSRICCTRSSSPRRTRTRASRTSIRRPRKRCRACTTFSPTRMRRSCCVPTLPGAGYCPSLCRGSSICKGKPSPSWWPRPRISHRMPPTRSRWITKFCPSLRC